jgi:uncharacterized membrane protein
MTHFPITFAVNSTARPGAGHSAEEVTEMVSYLIAIVIVFVSPLAVPVATTVFYAVRDWRRRAVDARAERSPAVGAVRPALRAAPYLCGHSRSVTPPAR